MPSPEASWSPFSISISGFIRGESAQVPAPSGRVGSSPTASRQPAPPA
jgi:hypothetical protein